MVHLHPDATYRVSKRGLVVAGARGESALFEHPLASHLPELVRDDPNDAELRERLGPPLEPHLIDDLREMEVLTDTEASGAPQPRDRTAAPVVSRQGLMFPGVAAPATWIDRRLVPLLTSWPGRVVLALLAVAGTASLLEGRPDVPLVSRTPALEAIIMIAIHLVGMVLHEFGHAVAMVHFGVRPRRAGFGFYWGALSFFVDSTPAMTLPRRQRVVQALAGLAVDLGIVFVLAVVARTAHEELAQIVAWRLAILGLFEVILNMLPFLQLDGHWALADWLDEPDLSARARRALGASVRRRSRTRSPGRAGSPPTENAPDDRWFVTYGIVSLLGGIALLAMSALVFWWNTGHLVVALLTGNVGDVLLGIYSIGPLVLGLVFSAVGLVLETVLGARSQPDPEAPSPHDRPGPY